MRAGVLLAGACLGGAALASGCSVPVVSPLVAPLFSPMASKPAILFHEPFNQLDPSRWREIEVKGRTQFSIEDVDGNRVLKAYSQAHASILVFSVRFNPDDYPWFSWRWRVDQVVEHEDLATRPGSDAPARVYVYFNTPGLPWQKRNLDYVWSSNTPIGAIMPSAYSKTSILMVIDGGAQHLGQWRAMSRNLREDYKAAFPGAKGTPDVLAIGILSDADSTLGVSSAYYDDFTVSREPVAPLNPAPKP